MHEKALPDAPFKNDTEVEWRAAVAGRRIERGVMAIDRDYLNTLRRFTDAADAQTVLEIGIGPESKSALTFAGAMMGGHVISIDIDPNRPRPQDRQAMAHMGAKWTVVIGDSQKVYVELEDEIDLLYVDGDHTYEYALGDFLRFEPYVRPGGYILVDDYPSFMGVVEAVAELERRGWKGLFLPYDMENNGHIIYRKPGFIAPWVKDSNSEGYTPSLMRGWDK